MILIMAAALVYLIGVIRAKETVTMIIALAGVVAWILVLLGVVQVNLG